ncbi:MAG: conserved exported protein of unknown function [Nitrospira sp.]|nr:MAG: conserved exported protein of unknown function [Nitrospira sp.]
MRSLLRSFTLTTLAFMAAAPAFAASHREAPLIANDPAADITDFYFFRSWNDPDKAVLIMNVIPGQEPGSGPNYFNFADDVLYEIHIDNNKNNVAANIVYAIRFKTEFRQPANVFPLSYAALPPITSLTGAGSEGLLLRQTYTVTETRYGLPSRELGTGTMYAVPSNVGPRTTPNYEQLAAKGIFPLKNGGRVFAGQRDETFYIDLGGTFDTLNLHISPILSPSDDANDALLVGAARDTFSGFNVNTIALEIPIRDLIGPNGNTLLGAYASTSRPKVTVIKNGGNRDNSSRFVQVARMGNPLVNELIIATDRKDNWNATDAEDEAAFLSYYCNSALATALNTVFGTGFPTANREDLVNALLRYSPGPPVCGSGKTNEDLSDLLRVDVNVPPTAAANQKRLGPLAHDASGNATPDKAGWPNGRRPNDDVTDVALRVVGGILINSATPYLGDGVNVNVGAVGGNLTGNGVSTAFPFLPTPFDGRDRRHIDPGESQ